MSSDTQVTLKKRKENPEDGELDITPMIDITFLLLAFFVIASKMDPQASVDLPKASFGQSVQDKECVVLIIAKDESGKETSRLRRPIQRCRSCHYWSRCRIDRRERRKLCPRAIVSSSRIDVHFDQGRRRRASRRHRDSQTRHQQSRT